MANYPFYQPPMQPMYGQAAMYQNPYMGQQMPVQQPVQPVPVQGNVIGQGTGQPAFICCPVTSKEEAVATRVEAFGPGVIMPDMGHGMIYYKRFNNNTALADFAQFKIVADEVEGQQAEQKPQAPALDFGAVIGSFQSRFDTMESKMDALAEKFDKQPRKRIVVKEADEE